MNIAACSKCGAPIDVPKRRLAANPDRRCWNCHMDRIGVPVQKRKDGYLLVRGPRGERQILQHRVIAEQTIGRPLRAGEVVHHRNGVRHDNRPENLEVCESAGKHVAEHHPRRKRGSAAVLTLVALVIMAILGLFLWGCDAPAAERDACWGIASCTADACRGIASCTAWEVREPRGIRQALEAQGRCGEALTALAACETRCPRED